MSEALEKRLFKLTEEEKEAILEGMAGCDAAWGLVVRWGESWSIREGDCGTLLDFDSAWEQDGLEGMELGLFFSQRVTRLGTLTALNAAGVTYVDLSGCKALTDINGLQGLQNLSHLFLNGCFSLTDLTPLQGLNQLTSLNLSQERIPLGQTALITDLTPLKGLSQLTSLNLKNCNGLADLTPLRSLQKLESLVLSDCETLIDLNGLQGLKKLKSLDLGNCQAITDLTPLRELNKLTTLNLQSCRGLSDLNGLQGLDKLTSLNLYWCRRLTDLTPLQGLNKLTSLSLSDCKALTDLTPLQGLNKLTHLDLARCSADLTPLQNLTTLTWLNLSQCEALTDLTPLQNLTTLTWLNLSQCEALTELSPLKGLTNLSSLNLKGCKALTDLNGLQGLNALTSLNLEGCKALTDLNGLQGLNALTSLNLESCEALTHIKPLAKLDKLDKLTLNGSGNIRDLDRLSACTRLRELTWTEAPACHAVLAAIATRREDTAYVTDYASDWLHTMRLSKIPDTYSQRLVAAFALGGANGWAVDALTTLATEARARGLADEEALNALTADTWTRWAEAALNLGDPSMRRPVETALAKLEPRREVAVLLSPVLTTLADLPSRAPGARDWALALVDSTLTPLTENEDIAREAAPAAAVFYAAFGLDDHVRRWLDYGTHQHSPRWRDRVVLALLRWCAQRDDLQGARGWLAQVQTPELRDPAHAELARALAHSAPEQAVTEHLEAIEDAVHQTALAAELAQVPAVTGTVEGLYGLLLVLQEAPETLADLLERLVADHPDNLLVGDIAMAFGGTSEVESATPRHALAPLCTHPVVLDFLGRRSRPKLEALQERLEQEGKDQAALNYQALAALLVSEDLMGPEDVAELVQAMMDEDG